MSDSPKDHVIPFKIDRADYKLLESQNPTTGQHLRSLPPVAEDYDLWLRGHGGEDDRIIEPGDTVVVKAGDHFFTAKKVISPGQ